MEVKTKHELPENVAEANGEEEVCHKFKNVYERLYNSADTTDEVNMIKSEVETDIKAESLAEVLKITGQVVKAAAETMKNNKSDVSRSYVWDEVKNAPDIFFENIACVFRSWMFHGRVPISLLALAFIPLLKNALQNPAETKSYRAIAGSLLLLKLINKGTLILWHS